jgi:hypothetical protein
MPVRYIVETKQQWCTFSAVLTFRPNTEDIVVSLMSTQPYSLRVVGHAGELSPETLDNRYKWQASLRENIPYLATWISNSPQHA